MAELPSANTNLVSEGGGIGNGTELIAVMSCMQSGTDDVYTRFSRTQDILDEFGFGEGVDFVAHYIETTRKPVVFGKLAEATAGALSNADQTNVTGTSVVTFTGTPYDDAEIRVEVPEDGGGTIGTLGCKIDVSVDGGRTFKRNIPLGTATTYVIPNTGVTVNFAAGTLVEGDYASVVAKAPMWDAAGLTAAFAALLQTVHLPRFVIIMGELADDDQLQDVIDEIEAFEAANRFTRVICAVRDRYHQAVFQGGVTISVLTAGDTYTRSGGSWITEGFKVGMKPVFAGFSSGGNNGQKTIVTLTATVMTVSENLVDEAVVADVTCTAPVETFTAWKNALAADIVGNSVPSLKISHRTSVWGGRARRKSPIDSSRKRRPSSWALACKWMQHDVQVSPAYPEGAGELDGWTITDEDGNLEDFDERAVGGLLANRIGCLRTYAEIPGVFIALPITLDNDNANLSRLPVGGVADIACTIVQRETTKKLNASPLLNDDGTITTAERMRIEESVLTALKKELLSEKREGQRASNVTFTMAGDVDISEPGAEVLTETVVVPRGTVEKISNTVRVRKAA